VRLILAFTLILLFPDVVAVLDLSKSIGRLMDLAKIGMDQWSFIPLLTPPPPPS